MYLLTKIREECVGCEACKNVCPKKCIYMKEDKEGFFYPEIKYDECIDCGICKLVCPIKNDVKFGGCSIDVYALKHKDKNIQLESSSGGAFTAFAEIVLKDKGVVYASAFDSNHDVEVNRIDSLTDLKKARKSKYVQSRMNNVHKLISEDLMDNRAVLFVGTACQCDSVRTYLDLKKVNQSNLLLIDIICHGVASPKIWNEYLQQHEKNKNSQISDVDFRDKSSGWTPMKMKIAFDNNEYYINSSRFDSYYRLFFGHYIIRPACHSCQYAKIQRNTDITLADFWGIQNLMPKFYDVNGVSMVMLNSEKGKNYLDRINNAIIQKVECNDITCYQPNLTRPTPINKNREKFWLLYEKKGFIKALKKYGEFTKIDVAIDDLKNILVRILKQ